MSIIDQQLKWTAHPNPVPKSNTGNLHEAAQAKFNEIEYSSLQSKI
jgi:hypothetical protein